MASCTCANPTTVAQAIRQGSAAVTNGVRSTGEYMDQTIRGMAMGSPHGAMSPTRFCHWVAPEYGPIGESGWTTAFRAAAIAIAVANGVAQAEISDKQMDLAEGYYRQAKYKWDRFRDKYLPLEKEMLDEVSNVPIPQLDCADAYGRAFTTVDTAFTATNAFMKRTAKQYRLCLDPTLQSVVNQKRAVALVDTANFNYRDDEFFTDYKTDQRWNRRGNMLNLGRNLSSEALKYGDVARSLYGQVGKQLDRAAGGVVQALGYYGARNDTVYPTTYLGSAGGMSNMLVSTSNDDPIAGISNSLE